MPNPNVPEWMPKGQQELGQLVARLNHMFAEGEMLSLTVVAERTDGGIFWARTPLEASLVVMSILRLINADLEHEELAEMFGEEVEEG